MLVTEIADDRLFAISGETVEPFSRRHELRREYSGPGEITPELRERLRVVIQRYVARGYIGIGQENLWVPQRELDHRLTMHFGKPLRADEILAEGEWSAVLDVVEIFLAVAERMAWRQHREISGEIAQAFRLSGSVYFVTREGIVALRLEDETAQRIQQAIDALKAIDKAKEVFQRATAGLVNRRMEPEDVVKNTYVAFEEFLKEKTGQKDFPDSVKAIRGKGILTATQIQIIERLYGFRSEVFGATHAGEARAPKESDALWFLDTVSAQIVFLDRIL